MNEDIYFELVREEAPYHECGHYHWPAERCPDDARACTSELCCVFGGRGARD